MESCMRNPKVLAKLLTLTLYFFLPLFAGSIELNKQSVL